MSVEAIGLVGPAAPWVGGIAQFTTTLADPLLLLPYRTLVGAYRAGGGRIVLLCHNVLAHERRRTDPFLASRVLRLADALVVHSRADGELARALAPQGRIVELVLVPRATLHVAGRFEGPRRPYERLVARLGLQDRVTLDDRYIPDGEVDDLFAAADAVVAPYREASQSGVAQLALSHGRPVAAPPSAGSPRRSTTT